MENSVEEEFVVMTESANLHLKNLARKLRKVFANGQKKEKVVKEDFVVTENLVNVDLKEKKVCEEKETCSWRFYKVKKGKVCRRRNCCKGRRCRYTTKKLCANAIAGPVKNLE